MNDMDSLVSDPHRGSNFVARSKNHSFIPVGDANRNDATATRLKIRISPLSYNIGFPAGINNKSNEILWFISRSEAANN